MHNGMAALHELEADRAVVDASYPANGVSILDASGSLLEQRAIDPPGRTLTRAALYRVLQGEAARRGVRIDRGRRLVNATVEDGGIRAALAEGRVAQGDSSLEPTGFIQWSVASSTPTRHVRATPASTSSTDMQREAGTIPRPTRTT